MREYANKGGRGVGVRERLIRTTASVHEIRPKIGHLPSSLQSRRIVQDFRKCPSPLTYNKYKRENDKGGGKEREENKIKQNSFKHVVSACVER
jgi:hypothetical protein